MPANAKRKTRRLAAAVTGTPWMLLESTLQQMVEFLELRHSGELQTPQDIADRLARSDHGRGVSRANSLNFDPQDDDDFDGPVVVDGGIAILPLRGILAPRLSWMDEISGGTSTERFKAWFQEAIADARVNAILTHVDSPGGSAAGNEELATVLRDARGLKPAWAVAEGMCASAAYYVGSAFARLYASPSTEVGSVGTYMIHSESSIADKADGYTYTVIKAGEFKAAGNSVEPLGPRRSVLQERIDAYYGQFVAAVAANRGRTPAEVEASFGQGKVMLAAAALAVGMVDGVKTFDEVLAELQSQFRSKAAVPGRGARGSTVTRSTEGTSVMLKAQLLKMGLIKETDSDETVRAVMTAFCRARGVDVPAEEAAQIALLTASIQAQQQQQPSTTSPPGQPSAPQAQPGATQDEAAIRAAERNRIENLRASAELLDIDGDTLSAAIEAGSTVDAVLPQWRKLKAASEQSLIKAGKQQGEKFHSSAVNALAVRAGIDIKLSAEERSEFKDLTSHRMLDIGRICLSHAGVRTVGMDDDDIAKAILGSHQTGTLTVPRAGSEGYLRTGDFPGIMSNLAGKILDQPDLLVETTFREWTDSLPAVADFKPKTLHATGEFGEFPVHEDGDPFDPSSNSEEATWIQVDEFGDSWALTPRMIINDDLGALVDVLEGKEIAHDTTLERLCVNLLVGNVVAQDGTALFDDPAHGNDITGGNGGVPSTTQLSLMRKKLRKIYGLNGKVKLSQTLAKLLIPEDLETVTEQLLAELQIVPVTETTTQIFRKKVSWVVVPMLAESSTSVYYGISSARRRAIVRVHQRGFERMKTTSYFDPKTECRVWNFKGRFGAAVRTYRSIIRNAGA